MADAASCSISPFVYSYLVNAVHVCIRQWLVGEYKFLFLMLDLWIWVDGVSFINRFMHIHDEMLHQIRFDVLSVLILLSSGTRWRMLLAVAFHLSFTVTWWMQFTNAFVNGSLANTSSCSSCLISEYEWLGSSSSAPSIDSCISTMKFYVWACLSGYHLEHDGRSC